jgi:hypothetical protein
MVYFLKIYLYFTESQQSTVTTLGKLTSEMIGQGRCGYEIRITIFLLAFSRKSRDARLLRRLRLCRGGCVPPP